MGAEWSIDEKALVADLRDAIKGYDPSKSKATGRFDKVEAGVREQGERIDRVEVRVASLDTRLSEPRDLVRTAPTAVPAINPP